MIAPIAIRELLVASRRPVSWRIRLAMTICALIVATFVLNGTGPVTSAGSRLFETLSFILFAYALLAGFMFTADSISEERREGTFGLLYLTPLNSWDVIAGKLASTSLQGFYGFIAIIPVLALSFLAGGVAGQDATRVVVVIGVTLLLSLAAGIFASASAQSRRGAVGLTGMLTVAPLIAGWLGVMLAAVLAYVSEQEKRKRANVYWFSGYVLLIFLLVWLVAVSNVGLIGSPAVSLRLAWGGPDGEFFPSIGALLAITLFYLFSAGLCTEWFRAAREIVLEQVETETELDELIFPGLRSKVPVGNNPAHWLLTFLQTRPFLFYIALALMIVINIGHGAAPMAFGRGYFFLLFGLFPYILFNFSLARHCAAPFHLLERSGFMETLLTTPLRPEELARAQRKLFWRTLRLPLLFLVLASVPAVLVILGQEIFGVADSPGIALRYIAHWIIGWAVFALQLETLALFAMHHSLRGRKPLNSALRATALVLIPSLAMNIVIPIAWNLARWSGLSGYFFGQLIGEIVLAMMFLALLSRAKRKLGLSRNLLNP